MQQSLKRALRTFVQVVVTASESGLLVLVGVPGPVVLAVAPVLQIVNAYLHAELEERGVVQERLR